MSDQTRSTGGRVAATARHDAENLANGETVGRFQVRRLLGSGGMGRVYLARDLMLGRSIALKMITDHDDPGRVLEEARAIARLNHPNIVHLYEYGTYKSGVYLALEYVDGLSLHEIDSSGPIDVVDLLRHLRTTAEALAYAHSGSVVHGNLKPSHIMIGRDGRLLVVDFGPRPAARASSHGGGYVAPEQRLGLSITDRVDSWALGLLAGKLLGGEHPAGTDLAQLRTTEDQAAPVPIHFKHAAVPPDVAELVTRSLHWKPDLRPSAATWKSTLDDVLRDGARPSSTAPAPTTQPRFILTTDPAVHVQVFDSVGTSVASGDGEVCIDATPGLYRVLLDRGGTVAERLVDHRNDTEIIDPGPPLRTPALIRNAATSHEYYTVPARYFSTHDTCEPLDSSEDAVRLFVFVRREARDLGPRVVPSEPLALLAADGRRLATLNANVAVVDHDLGFLAFSCRLAPGTYRLHAPASRRQLAVTIPARRAAHVFIADRGTLALDQLRVSLVRDGEEFDPDRITARLLEDALDAIASLQRTVPLAIRDLDPELAREDLCLGIAVAHLAHARGDRRALEGIVERLWHEGALPDVAILRGEPLREALEPPLLRASLMLALDRELALGRAAQRAASTAYHDSVWCTWSARWWDERWIAPTLEALRIRDRDSGVPALARRVRLPQGVVAQTLGELDAVTLATACVPGYQLGETMGRTARGTTVRARRDRDGQAVGLELVPMSSHDAQRALEQMQRVAHPRVAIPTERGMHADGSGLWLERISDSRTVLELLGERDSPLDVDHACRLIGHAFEGLAWMHEHGIVHGAIEPGQLILREDSCAALGGVGLPPVALRFSPRTSLDGRANDLWSMAATLYFMLTLELPLNDDEDGVVSVLERGVDIPHVLALAIDEALTGPPAAAAALREYILSPSRGLPGSVAPTPPRISTPPEIETRPTHPRHRSAPDDFIDATRTSDTQRQEDSALGPKARAHGPVAHLRVLNDATDRAVHELHADGTMIGRIDGASDCEIQIGDARMSRRHAAFRLSSDGWMLDDLHSRNGGFVEGRSLARGGRVVLGDGAVIRLGDTVMVFRSCPPASDGRDSDPVFPGESPEAIATRRRIAFLATKPGHVLVCGATGTGKERVTRAVSGDPARQAYLVQSCAELTHELWRSELFGHVRGAFTGATRDRTGLVDLAQGGVLVLDEIGELEADVQADLLRFLEDGSYRAIGSSELRHSTARIVAATSRDLHHEAAHHRYRRDLLGRLSKDNEPLRLPSLHERREDIPGWVRRFLDEAGWPVPKPLWTAGALECLLLYPWPANLRELRGIVRTHASEHGMFPMTTQDLPEHVQQHRAQLRVTSIASGSGQPERQKPPPLQPTRDRIEELLARNAGSMRLTAGELGIDRRKLYRLCDRLRIDYRAFRSDDSNIDD